MRQDDSAQLQLVEVITVAVMLFTAIAISAVFRLPTSPATFQGAELERIGSDGLRVLANTLPTAAADCNEVGQACPFADGSDLERMLSLALGYVGPNAPSPESADRNPLTDFLNQAMPDGVNWIVFYSNGVNATKVAPLARNAPLLDVFVAHTLLAPNWTVHADHLGESVLVRIGEPGGFGTPSTIRDPLNRAQTEFGYALTNLYTGDIPENATLGTHEICYATCHFFTVTPPTIFGAGSQILTGDRDNSTNLRLLGADGDFFDEVRYQGSGGFAFGNALYVDVTSVGTVSAGDLRLSPVTGCRSGVDCPAGSFVASGDSDAGGTLSLFAGSDNVGIRGHDADSDGNLDSGEPVYLALDTSTAVAENHHRMSRVGVHALGSGVATGDIDEGDTLTLGFTGEKIWFDDLNADGNLDPGEAVYLDLAGSGLGTGLEEGDFHLTTKGDATARYFYDVRLVVWFGV